MMSKTPQVEKHFNASTIFTPAIWRRAWIRSRFASNRASEITKCGVGKAVVFIRAIAFHVSARRDRENVLDGGGSVRHRASTPNERRMTGCDRSSGGCRGRGRPAL